MTLPIHPEALKALFPAYQYRKDMIKSKSANARQFNKEREALYMEIADDYFQDDFNLVKSQVYTELDQIVHGVKINPKPWNWEKSHEISYCYPVGESRNGSGPI